MQENVNFSLPSDMNEQIENGLRDLLEKVLCFFEQLISTKEEVRFIEEQLNDYDSLLALIGIIKRLFLHLQRKITERLQNLPASDPSKGSEKLIPIQSADSKDYENLEKVVIKYEAEIRNHIRVEQQLKLFGETLQMKLDESEKIRNELLESSKKMLNDIKRDNQDLVDKLHKLNEGYSDLEKKLKKAELDKTLLENQLIGLGLYPYRFQSIEKTEKTQTNTLNSLNNDTSFQRVNLELDYAKKENLRQNSLHNKSPEKVSRRKNFSPQALLNNLINNQKKEKKAITDCLKLKIEIARGSNDLTSKIMSLGPMQGLKNGKGVKLPNFPMNQKLFQSNLSQSNPEAPFELKPEVITRKIQEKKKGLAPNPQNNKSNSHNSSLGPNQSPNDSSGIIRARSKSSHSKNNSFSSNRNPGRAPNLEKRLDNSFHVGNAERKNSEKNEPKSLALNLKLRGNKK